MTREELLIILETLKFDFRCCRTERDALGYAIEEIKKGTVSEFVEWLKNNDLKNAKEIVDQWFKKFIEEKEIGKRGCYSDGSFSSNLYAKQYMKENWN